MTILTVQEALAEIVAHVERLPAVPVALDEALGLVLAHDVVSDVDSPPFDKALMDGYAVRAGDLASGRATLRVIDEVLAGQVPWRPVGSGEATRIMTGAPIPEGADAVVQVEHTRPAITGSDAAVAIETTTVAAGRNIMKRGESLHKGTCVLPAGRQIRPQEIGALAELGHDPLAVYARPRVAVLSTGDELVPVGEVPGPGKIRNSNAAMLTAQLRHMGAEAVSLGVARDDPSSLRERIERGLAFDALVLSGGVSAGKLDLVPAVLAEAGVQRIFHKVQVKPGQPIWFGVFRRPPREESGPGPAPAAASAELHSKSCYVFGLPGNPVSSMVCCELFARTAIRRLMGVEPALPTPRRARLASDHFSRGNRPTYHPARFEWTESGAAVELVRWMGSADLSATVEANAMALFPEGERMYAAGAVVEVFLW